MEKHKLIERSIIKTYRSEIYAKLVEAINKYDMIKNGDKIAVCLSGGKDSFLMVKCMQEIQKHGGFDFEIKVICMDPGYSDETLNSIAENARLLNIEVHYFKAAIFEYVATLKKSPCYICARMRRGFLYEEAIKMGCNKLALGHHFDDVIETILLSVFYNGQFKTMMPKLASTSHQGIEIIRPLYLIKEENIIKWVKYNNLLFDELDCGLIQAKSDFDSKRSEMKKLIKTLKKSNPGVDVKIFKSAEKVNLKTIISYFDEDEEDDFKTHYQNISKKHIN